MLVQHITDNPDFMLDGSHTPFDSFCALPNGRGLFAFVEAPGVWNYLWSYQALHHRPYIVVLDMSNCRNEDFGQGYWFDWEVAIYNVDRVRLVNIVQRPVCASEHCLRFIGPGQTLCLLHRD